VGDIDTVVVDSLKALDPEWPIREADVVQYKCALWSSMMARTSAAVCIGLA
jgi:hypothetical protein